MEKVLMLLQPNSGIHKFFTIFRKTRIQSSPIQTFEILNNLFHNLQNFTGSWIAKIATFSMSVLYYAKYYHTVQFFSADIVDYKCGVPFPLFIIHLIATIFRVG